MKNTTAKIKVKYAYLKVPERKKYLSTMEMLGDVMITEL